MTCRPLVYVDDKKVVDKKIAVYEVREHAQDGIKNIRATYSKVCTVYRKGFPKKMSHNHVFNQV